MLPFVKELVDMATEAGWWHSLLFGVRIVCNQKLHVFIAQVLLEYMIL